MTFQEFRSAFICCNEEHGKHLLREYIMEARAQDQEDIRDLRLEVAKLKVKLAGFHYDFAD